MAQIELRGKDSTNEQNSTHLSVKSAVQNTNPVSSDSDSKSANSVDLVTHPTPPSQVESLVDDESDHAKEMPEGTIEDGGTSEYWEKASDFASHITEAARNALSNRARPFKKVVAVIAYWETAPGLGPLRRQADKLGTDFQDRFEFEVFPYKIPDDVNDLDFTSIIGVELRKVSKDRDSLFILYYGGHASILEFSHQCLWKKENRPSSPEIEWSSAIRVLFKRGVICSKLFIFDCCHAGGMIDSTLEWDTSCELLGACAADVQASALRGSSFTRALRKEVSNNTYNVWELHSALCSTEKRTDYNLKSYPCYRDFVSHDRQSGSTLIKKVGSSNESEHRPRAPSEILTRLETFTDAVVCIAITFKCTAEAFMREVEEVQKDWRRWFKFPPTECDDIIVKACRGPKLVAVFNSNSCITIWSFPVWLWDAMAPLRNYQHIGIMRPQNLALSASGAQTDLALLDSSSNTIRRKDSLSQRPSKPVMLPPIQDTTLEGTTGEDDPHLMPLKPPAVTSTKAKDTLKLPSIKLPEQPVQRETSNSGRWRNKSFSSTSQNKKQKSSSSEVSNAPLSTSGPNMDIPRSLFLLDEPAVLDPSGFQSLATLVDPREKKKASRIQNFKTPKELEYVLEFGNDPEPRTYAQENSLFSKALRYGRRHKSWLARSAPLV